MLVPTALQVLGGEGQEADGRKGTKVGREGGERQDKKGRGKARQKVKGREGEKGTSENKK